MNTVKCKYNIVVPAHDEYSLEDLAKLEIEQISRVIRIGGKFSWTLQTYHRLKELDEPVKLSMTLDRDCVNLVHINVLSQLKKDWSYYTVCIQGDYPHYPLANHYIVQNHDQLGRCSSYMPLWPQIGEIPRDGRRQGVRTVAFQGRIAFTDLDPARLNADLNPHGVEFKSLDNWQDLSSVDVLVGIRYYGKRRYHRKPASKLVNAWHARIPFVGGWDSAYSQIGTPGDNYLRVATHEELVSAILELKNNDTLYGKLIDAGAKRAEEYTTERIAQMWIDLLDNRIYPLFEGWQKDKGAAVLLYGWKVTTHSVVSTAKRLIRKSYRIPAIKRIRDLYYDPVN